MNATGKTYRKRPCVCGQPTSTAFQVRVNALGEKRQRAENLGTTNATLCDRCALALLADIDERIHGVAR